MKKYLYLVASLIIIQSCSRVKSEDNSANVIIEEKIFNEDKLMYFQKFRFLDSDESIFIEDDDTIKFEHYKSGNTDYYQGTNFNGTNYSIAVENYQDSIIKKIEVIDGNQIIDVYLITDYSNNTIKRNLFCNLNDISNFVRVEDKITNDLSISFLGDVCEIQLDSIKYVHKSKGQTIAYKTRFDFFDSGVIKDIECIDENGDTSYSKKNKLYSDSLIIWEEVLWQNHLEQETFYFPLKNMDSIVSYEYNDIGAKEKVGSDIYTTLFKTDTIELYLENTLKVIQINHGSEIKFMVYNN